MVHYGTPCYDLTYMLYLCVDPSVRWENYDLLIDVYHQSLVRTLERFEFAGYKPDLQEIRDEMDRLTFLGLFIFVFGLSVLFVEFDVNTKVLVETNGKEGFNIDQCKSMQKVIGRDLENLILNFL